MSRANDVGVVECGLMVYGGFRHEDITGYYNRVDDIKQADEQRIRHEFGKKHIHAEFFAGEKRYRHNDIYNGQISAHHEYLYREFLKREHRQYHQREHIAGNGNQDFPQNRRLAVYEP